MKIIKSSPSTPLNSTPLSSEEKKEISSLTNSFHSPCHRVPNGDSTYVKAKHVQIIEKDSSKAVMKHQIRADEVIEAIKLFRSLCSQQSQESLDNVLIDLYKRAGRIEEHIELLQHKLQLVEDGVSYGGQRTKIARAQGKMYLCSIEHEKSRLLGNLGWAYMQQENYQVAEELYRKALSIDPDKNKQCNLATCLMQKGKIMEAKSFLETVKPTSVAEGELADSYVKSFDHATDMLSELDSGRVLKPLEQKKDDNIRMETEGSFTSPVIVNSSSPVSSIYSDEENNVKRQSASYIHTDHNMVVLRNLEHSSNDIAGTLQRKFEAADQKQHQEPSAQYFYPNTHEYADWRKSSTPLRKDRLQVFKEITHQDIAAKDMPIIMKQLKNRADEAIEAVKSFGSLFSQQAQESLDNVLVDLYKKAGRIGEHIELLQHKLQLLEDSGKKSRCCSAEHEKSRLLGNLGWAYMQKKNYKVAIELYGKALSVEPDNKSNDCRLAICFIQIERIRIAKSLLQSLVDGGRGLAHSNFRVSSYTTKVQQSGIRKCLDNSHPSKGQHQNHGFARKWREEDPHLSSSSNSGKSWADMVEEEEEDEECSSLFSDCSAEKTVESVSEWSSDDLSYRSQEDNKWNDKNEAVYSSDDNLSDAEDNLQWKFEAADINGEFRKPAARRSLYFDQKQEHEPSAQQYLHSNTHECAGSNRSTCSDSDSDSSGVHFPYDMDRFGETLKHELGDVKKGIKSVYVSQPPVHEKHKGGTVVIVFLDGSKLYVLSDSRLSYEFIHPDTAVKEYRICYHDKGKFEGLRVKVEEVGEKITACEGFITALAGNYKIAHHVCANLKQMWINEEIGSDHRFLVEIGRSLD
ncbi:hypothetical protein MKW92_038043 [Papaver armeniacum]|nr:hypothetical protein MKW92_038043 [Papaver armeniacum]